jgi:hypothetical protein
VSWSCFLRFVRQVGYRAFLVDINLQKIRYTAGRGQIIAFLEIVTYCITACRKSNQK